MLGPAARAGQCSTASVAGQDGNVGSGLELGFEFKVVQRELADGLGVDLDEAPEVFVFPAEPLYSLVGVFAAAGCPGPLHGGGLVVRPLAEVVDQVPVVAVEGGMRDAQCPLDSGHGGLVAVRGGLGEDTCHDGVDLVIGGQGLSHAFSGWARSCLARKAVI